MFLLFFIHTTFCSKLVFYLKFMEILYYTNSRSEADGVYSNLIDLFTKVIQNQFRIRISSIIIDAPPTPIIVLPIRS